MSATTVAIVGGGITGLAAAYELSRGDDPPRVVLLEAGERLGGKIRTNDFCGVPVEAGPDAVLARVPWAVDLMTELGLETELVSPATGAASVYCRGKLRPLPDGLVLGVPARFRPVLRSGVLSPLGIARAGLDLVLPRRALRADPTITEVIAGRFGLQVVDRLVDPLLSGINAGRADALSLQATAPEVATIASGNRSLLLGLRARQRHAPSPAQLGPIFVSVRGGLAVLVDRLVAALDAAGVDVRTGTPATALAPDGGAWRVAPVDEPVDAVVLTTPAFVTGPLLAAISPRASAELGSVEYSSVAVATLAYRDAALPRPLEGSGFLVPRGEGWLMTAATFVSSKWPALRPPGRVVVRCSAGRFGDDRPGALTDDGLVRRLHSELERAIGVTEGPAEWRVDRWDRSFPQYGSGHLARADRIDEALAADAPGLVVTGASMRGVGLAACVRQGRAAARSVTTGGPTPDRR